MRHAFDIALSPEGDLVLTADSKDLGLVSKADYIRQTVMDRLKSVTTEWVGADLERFLGRDNTFEVAEEIRTAIIGALTFDDLVAKEDVFIEAKPSSKTSVLLVVYVRDAWGGDPMIFAVSLDYQIGAHVTEV